MFFDQGTIFILTCWGVDKPANQKIGYQFPLLHSPKAFERLCSLVGIKGER